MSRKARYLMTGAALCTAFLGIRLSYVGKYQLAFPETESIDAVLLVLDLDPEGVVMGDIVMFEHDTDWSPPLKYTKYVAGLAGDRVEVDGDVVSVNGTVIGRAKPETSFGVPLETIEAGPIPEGYLFVRGLSENSHDSRYRTVGLVALDRVEAVAEVIF